MQEFIQEHFKGCPLSWAIHEGYEDHNPHAHIMFSERRIQNDKEQGFSAKRFFKRNGVKKDREIHHKSFCSTHRLAGRSNYANNIPTTLSCGST